MTTDHSLNKPITNSSSFTQHLARNVQNLMQKKSITDSDLARALNLPYNTIKRITSGETTDPKISTLTMIADYLDVGIDALLGINGYRGRNKQPTAVPIVTWQELEHGQDIRIINPENWEHWQPIIMPSDNHLGLNSFAIESRKSMQPRYPLGTMFVIDPDEKPSDGDTVLVKVASSNELTLRELIIDPPVWQLVSINDDNNIMTHNPSDYPIMGVVLCTMSHLR